jgi:hypothetical protein
VAFGGLTDDTLHAMDGVMAVDSELKHLRLKKMISDFDLSVTLRKGALKLCLMNK